MRFWSLVLVLLSCCLASEALALPTVVDCVQQPPSGGCTNNNWLRNLNSFTANAYVSAAGYHAPGDSAGGLFLAGADGSCQTVSVNTAGSVTQGSYTVVLSTTPPSSVKHGMSIASTSPSGFIFSYDIITNISGSTLTLETPVANSSTGSLNLTISPDNGGSIIGDSETTPGPRCFYRSSSQYSPKEWGAFEDSGADDDTVALQSWLYSNQSFMTTELPSTVNIPPQPHIAVPGTSVVSFPLVCPADTTIQGPTNKDGSGGQPVFSIAANGGLGVFPTSSEVMIANDYCRFSGIGINGSDVATSLVANARGVTVDGSSALINGNPYNLSCGVTGAGGALEIKDTWAVSSYSDNIYMPSNCRNVRLIGDHISGAGTLNTGTSSTGRGVVFGGEDLTIADGAIFGSEGNGIDIEGGNQVSVTGMYVSANGANTTSGGWAIYIKDSNTISVCGNHFNGNDGATTGTTAHVFFDNTSGSSSTGISFCGNSYLAGAGGTIPQYVYDASPSAAMTATSFYENPAAQGVGVLSATAAAVLPRTQVLPAPRAFLTGFVLTNDSSSPNDTVDIATGQATDSTGVAVISFPSTFVCKVDLSGTPGLGHLDTGSIAASTTYFYFVVQDLTVAAAPSCIASKSLSPTFASTGYGLGVYRLVAALYTDGFMHVVQFSQDGDTFYLANSVTDIKTSSVTICSVGVSAGPCPLSVPCGRTASATACPSPGFAVQAFGRIVGGYGASGTNELLLSSYDQLDQTPQPFPTAPGNTNSGGLLAPAGPPVFPFHLTTDGNGNVRARATASGVTAFEVTDGWVWHRQQ